MKEVVLDTNVFVSALLARIKDDSPPRKILSKIAAGEVGLVVSPRILAEIVSILERPKLRLFIPESKIADTVSLIHQSARIVKPTVSLHACRDSKDNTILECAVAARVDVIISGDKDLLDLDPFQGIAIVSPRKFLSFLKSV